MATETKAKTLALPAALVAAQAEFTVVAKDRKNPFFKSEYATLEAIVAMLRPVLSKYGLGYTQGVEWRGDRCVLATHIFAADGEEVVRDVPYTCNSTKPQDLGSALTYAKRYGLQAAFGVVIANDTDDDDGNRASGIRPPSQSRPAPKPAPAVEPSEVDF